MASLATSIGALLPGRGVSGRAAALLAAGAVAAAAAAVLVRRKTRQAEREHPPIGKFIEVDGVRLHYMERSPVGDENAKTVVLLHGNGTMAEDFDISGVLDLAGTRFRVIAFDRPGY